jgi:hypothetical protein
MYVKRDGVQYRVDGVMLNQVFMHSQHDKSFALDVSTGTLVSQKYHPITLARYTLESNRVIKGILKTHLNNEDFESSWLQLENLKLVQAYEVSLHMLAGLKVPSSVVPMLYLPIIEAFIVRVPAKELYQGIKTMYDFEAPKMQVNYLSQGYLMEGTLQELLWRVMEHVGDVDLAQVIAEQEVSEATDSNVH